MKKPKHHIFICTSTRLNGMVQGACEKKGSHNLLQLISEELIDRGMDDEVIVTSTGCLGICDNGPVLIIYPEGTWYGKVSEDDIEDILDALEGGDTVERLLL